MHGNAYNWKQDEERRILAREAEDVSRRKLYDGKAKYGGMNVSQALEAKGLRDENTRWRKLGADLSLDKGVLQSVTEKTDVIDEQGRPQAIRCDNGPEPTSWAFSGVVRGAKD